jgi:hypothetical protein
MATSTAERRRWQMAIAVSWAVLGSRAMFSAQLVDEPPWLRGADVAAAIVPVVRAQRPELVRHDRRRLRRCGRIRPQRGRQRD